MASITQNADGSYSRSYSDLELSLIKGLVDENKLRQQGDQELWVDITGVTNRVKALEDKDLNYTFIQEEVIRMMKEIEGYKGELSKIDLLLGIDTYSQEEVNTLLALWYVEQIPHIFTQPRSSMFNLANVDEIKSGYKGYLLANINEPHDNHIPENIMQRYTINAFMEVPKQVTFHVSFADRCTFSLNDLEMGVWADAEGNFSSVPKVLVLDFKEGWNKVEIMIANETQRGGLVVKSDLYEKADYLNNLSNFTGMITGSRIAPGTIDETHLSPNMNLVVDTIRATAEDKPAVVVGNPEACGILQIGDKTISKCVNEPFVFDDGIRVNGYIYVSQLLIDKDFIIEGDGIYIEKQIDATTGFTEAYIIHNDMTITNGGGLTIVGDARKGYTITNAMKLIADGDLNSWLPPNPAVSDAGIDISGDAVKGYYIRNSMVLSVEGTGGLLVTGNAHDGYYIKNTMNLSSPKGLQVEGVPSEAAGYKLRNTMTMTGSGVVLTKSEEDGSIYNWDIENDTKIHVGNGLNIDKIAAGEFKIWNILEVLAGKGIKVNTTGDKASGFSKFEIVNDMKLSSTCGGIEVKKEDDGHWSIKNTMSLTHNSLSPIKRIDGDACTGYSIEAAWPTINHDLGINVTSNNNGTYTIKNTGVVELDDGLGINVYNRGNGKWEIENDGVVELDDGDGIDIQNRGNGKWEIINDGVISLVDGDGIEVSSQNGGAWKVENTGVLSVGVSGQARNTGTTQNPVIHVDAPPPPPTVNLSSPDGSIIINNSGSNWTLALNTDALPEVEIPDYPDPPPTEPGGELGYIPGTGNIASSHGIADGGGYGFNYIEKLSNSTNDLMGGIAAGYFTWNESSRFELKIAYAVEEPVSIVKIEARIFEDTNTAGEPIKTFSGNGPSVMYPGNPGPGEVTINVVRSQLGSYDDLTQVYVGVFITVATLNQSRVYFKPPNTIPKE